MFKTREVCLRCEDHAETVEFVRYDYDDGSTNYEINIVDSYCGYDFMGIKNRFKRAWKAFWAKSICYTGVYVEDPQRMHKFILDCDTLMMKDRKDRSSSKD